jgi:hypothetical protein
MITRALKQCRDLETAAQSLDITRKGLFLKRQRLGLDVTARDGASPLEGARLARRRTPKRSPSLESAPTAHLRVE